MFTIVEQTARRVVKGVYQLNITKHVVDMRRVSKAKSAAIAEQQSPLKRNASKSISYVEDDADDESEEPPAPKAKAPPTPNKNGKPADSASASEDEGETYEVELILGSRMKNGKQQYKIRWKGYGPADDTWEYEEDVDSPDLVAAFNKKEKDSPKVSPTKASKKASKRVSSSTPKEKAKKLKSDKNGVDADSDTEYEVSKIIDYVDMKDGTRQFLVRWKGFTAKHDTWEPEKHLNCHELIQKFLAAEKDRDDNERETREVKRQVNRYNPELSKRSSHRFRTKQRVNYHELE